MKGYLSRFRLDYVRTLIYMLQATEYHAWEFVKWCHRTKDFGQVMRRRVLVWTNKARLLYAVITGVQVAMLGAVAVLVFWPTSGIALILIGLFLLMLLPILLEFLLVLVVKLGDFFITRPLAKKRIAAATEKLAGIKAVKIAVVGSYGKTTTKEVLKTILASGKRVQATPGNMNQPLSIAEFIMGLSGDEEILIFEIGEYHMGDVRKMCEIVRPDFGVITGVSEAHLANFKTLENIKKTFDEIRAFVPDERLYLNGDNAILADEQGVKYAQDGMAGFKVSGVKLRAFGTEFTMNKEKVQTALLGAHNIGVVVLGMYLAEKQFGAKREAVKRAVAELKPFEHRMEPKKVNGAVVIDDTYNGNLEGVKAGLKLLKSLEGKRKIYVTPGLVEQGKKTAEIHTEIGREIGFVASEVVLMNNSTTQFIQKGLDEVGFAGEVKVVDSPLLFYENLPQYVAQGDIVLMQNDWTDNYA
ncbi:MAG: UDP-N-acetylmuramoyl-tripeptide--D-alanyl-D-alanine ligase [Candidatus Nomurabacteria bacterium]|jgi:UDP-N-acetylmuramoyl-tripeptide--D-alanyl-D-alanine ligase|nr:UDP-N-acetylmuramoyl-tripeptide--D-alanyl-D-alanine ligase [Candidatus Nomurabacteria bacterium]